MVELMITVAVFSLVLGSLALVARANDGAFRAGAVISDLESRTADVSAKLVSELEVAVRDSLVPVPGAVGVATIDYEHVAGISGGAVTPSPRRRIGFEYDLGEINDGVDNNGNGLVDEGRLVLTENVGEPDQRRRILTRWVAEWLEGEQPNGIDDNGNQLVDEPGFVVVQSGDTLTLRFTVQRLDGEGRLLSRTATTSVKLRN